MFNGWLDNLLVGIQTLNQILTAGIAITAFSLFLYSLSFNLRDRVARSFAIILLCVVVVFTTEALQNNTLSNWGIEAAAALAVDRHHLSAGSLSAPFGCAAGDGRAAFAWRRRFAVRGRVWRFDVLPAAAWEPDICSARWSRTGSLRRICSGRSGRRSSRCTMLRSWSGRAVNFARAYSRMLTRSGRRRMLYLMAGATAPALGSYPYLLFGSGLAAQFPSCSGAWRW